MVPRRDLEVENSLGVLEDKGFKAVLFEPGRGLADRPGPLHAQYSRGDLQSRLLLSVPCLLKAHAFHSYGSAGLFKSSRSRRTIPCVRSLTFEARDFRMPALPIWLAVLSSSRRSLKTSNKQDIFRSPFHPFLPLRLMRIPHLGDDLLALSDHGWGGLCKRLGRPAVHPATEQGLQNARLHHCGGQSGCSTLLLGHRLKHFDILTMLNHKAAAKQLLSS